MTSAALCKSVRRSTFLAALAFFAMCSAESVGHADNPAAAAIGAAAAACEESLQTLETRLVRENLKLERLAELKVRGHATWREVAEQQVIAQSLLAERKAAGELAAFVAALRERSGQARCEPDSNPWGDRPEGWNLECIGLRLAAARANANSDLRAAEIAVRREQLRLAALDRLLAAGGTSAREFAQARQRLSAAQSLVELLAGEKVTFARAYESLRESSVGEPLDYCSSANDLDEVRAEDVPERVFSVDTSLTHFLALRQCRVNAAAQEAALAAQEDLLEELLRRQEKARDRGASVAREIERTGVDCELARAERRAAGELATILRLEELQFVARYRAGDLVADLANEPQPKPFIRLGVRIEADPFEFLSTAPHRFRTVQSNSALLGARNVIAWPTAGCTIREATSRRECRAAGAREPSYSDYYENGIRRTDLPHQVRENFAPGSIPWYLPGSPTNFR